MKPKFLYAAILVICLGLFTSAKQSYSFCMADVICKKILPVKTVKKKNAADKSFDLSPLRHFIFIPAISN